MSLTRPYAVLDVETTGTNVAIDRVCQIAIARFSPDGIPTHPANVKLINPTIPIPAETTEIHGISNEMVIDKPPFSQYARSIYNLLEGLDVVGHNIADFDIPLLSEEFSRCGISWPRLDTKIIDTLKIFQKKEPRDLKAAAMFYCGLDFTDGHDAGRDVDINGKVLAGMLSKYPDLAGMDASDLQNFCIEKRRVDVAGKIVLNDNGEMVWRYGKHQNEVLDRTKHFGYAKWMIGQKDTLTHTKNILKGFFSL
jgi:DNA polymerase-3 subunit epsilon